MRRKALLIVLLLALLYPVQRSESNAAVTWDDVISWLHEDAATYGATSYVYWLESVLWCESTGDPYAYGSHGEIGPAQFLTTYHGIWWSLPESHIVPLDYSYSSLRVQVQAFVHAFSRGLSRYWSCA